MQAGSSRRRHLLHFKSFLEHEAVAPFSSLLALCCLWNDAPVTCGFVPTHGAPRLKTGRESTKASKIGVPCNTSAAAKASKSQVNNESSNDKSTTRSKAKKLGVCSADTPPVLLKPLRVQSPRTRMHTLLLPPKRLRVQST